MCIPNSTGHTPVNPVEKNVSSNIISLTAEKLFFSFLFSYVKFQNYNLDDIFIGQPHFCGKQRCVVY